jgi:hypothetical protein
MLIKPRIHNLCNVTNNYFIHLLSLSFLDIPAIFDAPAPVLDPAPLNPAPVLPLPLPLTRAALLNHPAPVLAPALAEPTPSRKRTVFSRRGSTGTGHQETTLATHSYASASPCSSCFVNSGVDACVVYHAR